VGVMIRIGILEDEIHCFKKLNDCIMRYGAEHNLEFHVDLFTTGLAMVEADITKYDIVFLDIQVPMVNGLKVAKNIREKDKDVTIIFVTNLAQYAIYGYEVDALDYILKPIKYSSMEFRLNKAVMRVNKNKQSAITLYINREHIRVNLSDIYYVEANKHQTIYHTLYGDYEVWESFTEAAKRLAPYPFAKCHGSYLCNLKWVHSINDTEAVIKDVAVLKLSRTQKKSFADALTSYWAEMGG